MRFAPPILFCCSLFILNLSAEDADDLRAKGIAALKDSQSNPHAIVDAARHFVKASELYATAGNEEKSVEMNSFLYWCKKKMTLQDIDAFIKGGEAAVSTKLATVEKLAPTADEAQTWYDRAEKFATANPAEHLLIAIRYFEVADRFQGSSASLKAQDRSLKELLQEKSSAAKSAPPPVAVSAPKAAAISSGSQPVPPAAKLKEAEKVIKDLFKAEYAKTDPGGRLALVAKLLQQADENKDDLASLYVLLHEARDLAVAAGDSTQALAAQKRLCTAFNFDFAAIQNDLKPLDATAKTEAVATALAALYSAGAEDALEADNFEQSVRFQLHTDDLLPLIKDAATKARLKMEIDTAKALKRDSVPALAALKTLSAKPDDPEANLAAGKFALQRGRFETAFAHLAKGKDAPLSSVAKRELTPPTDAAEQVKLADDWFERAEKEPYTHLKVRMQERAGVWYGNALPTLAGLSKLKVEGRMKSLPVVTKVQPVIVKLEPKVAKYEPVAPPPKNQSPASGKGAPDMTNAAEVKVEGSSSFIPLVENETRGLSKVSFGKIPEWLTGRNYYPEGGTKGVLKFSVEKPGVVMIACTSRWGGGGNKSGGWFEECKKKEDLVKGGWKESGALPFSNGDALVLFWRMCQKGEQFSIRTEKYIAPLLIK